MTTEQIELVAAYLAADWLEANRRQVGDGKAPNSIVCVLNDGVMEDAADHCGIPEATLDGHRMTILNATRSKVGECLMDNPQNRNLALAFLRVGGVA